MTADQPDISGMSIDEAVRQGFAMQGQGRHEDAVRFFSRAEETADRIDALGGLAFSYRALGQIPDALVTYQRLLALKPDLAETHYEIGTLLLGSGLFDQATDFFRTAVRLNPDFLPTYLFLAYVMLMQCSWENIESVIARVQECVASQDPQIQRQIPLFVLLALPLDRQSRLRISRLLSDAAGVRTSATELPVRKIPARPLKKIGYLSPDFRAHSVGLAIQDILAHHDHQRYEIYGYSVASGAADSLTDSLKENFTCWRDLAGRSHVEVAEAIRADDIDILIDLAGHTRGARLESLALRPARIQAHFLGYGFTMGAEYIDYLITDGTTTPSAHRDSCSEALVYLPYHSLPVGKVTQSHTKISRSDYGLPLEGFVFADFNSHHKIENRAFDAWMRILKQVENSILWLMDGDETTKKNLNSAARTRGVDPDRILFAKRLPHEDHCLRLKLVGLALDTFLHAGGVTTTDALCAGIPVLVLNDRSTVDATGVSLVRAADMPELVTTSETEYVARAVELARSPEKLHTSRQKLAASIARPAPLFDNKHLTHDLENAFEQMWTIYQSDTPPVDVFVRGHMA